MFTLFTQNFHLRKVVAQVGGALTFYLQLFQRDQDSSWNEIIELSFVRYFMQERNQREFEKLLINSTKLLNCAIFFSHQTEMPKISQKPKKNCDKSSQHRHPALKNAAVCGLGALLGSQVDSHFYVIEILKIDRRMVRRRNANEGITL